MDPITPSQIDYGVIRKVVPPHKRTSRPVTEEDLDYVAKQAKILYDICLTGAYAMHHAQIEGDDPMNFFVKNKREIIINPKIVKHSNYTVEHNEGCVTFPGRRWVDVPRWQKCEVEYVTIMLDTNDKDKFKLSSLIEKSLSGMEAFIWQHEADHGDGKYIYQLDEFKE